MPCIQTERIELKGCVEVRSTFSIISSYRRRSGHSIFSRNSLNPDKLWNMRNLLKAIVLATGLLGGCAMMDETLPVLGVVEDGVYTQPDGAFRCPLPGPEQGFEGDVTIIDAGEIIRTRQVVIPVGERRPGEGSMRNEIIYPNQIVPNPTIRFTDAADDNRWVEILHRPMRDVDEAETVYASGYGGGNYGLLRETRGNRDGREYGMAVLQLPYFLKGPGYMGLDLWKLYLNGDDPGPDVDVVLNLIEDERHYEFVLHTTSLEFLEPGVNPKDLMAVNDALKADTQLLATLENRLFNLARACRFSPLAEE